MDLFSSGDCNGLEQRQKYLPIDAVFRSRLRTKSDAFVQLRCEPHRKAMRCPRSIRVESQLRARSWVRSTWVVQHMPRLRVGEKLIWFALPLVHRIEHDGHGGFQIQPWHALPRRDNALVILRRLH